MPDDEPTAIEAGARRHQLPTAEEDTTSAESMTAADLAGFADTFTDLADPGVMRRAWD